MKLGRKIFQVVSAHMTPEGLTVVKNFRLRTYGLFNTIRNRIQPVCCGRGLKTKDFKVRYEGTLWYVGKQNKTNRKELREWTENKRQF